MFGCWDEEVKKNNFNYKTDYYDYEGPSSTFDDDKDDFNNGNKYKDDDNDDEDDEDDEDDGNQIDIISPNNSYNINFDFALILICLISLILWN